MSRKKSKSKNVTNVPQISNDEKPKSESVEDVPLQVYDADGDLIKLKRADFPYTRKGIIAYCDYRVEYWKAKKSIMLAKTDPMTKIQRKRATLMEALKKVDAQIEAERKTNS